jgi:hypothetical protein
MFVNIHIISSSSLPNQAYLEFFVELSVRELIRPIKGKKRFIMGQE